MPPDQRTANGSGILNTQRVDYDTASYSIRCYFAMGVIPGHRNAHPYNLAGSTRSLPQPTGVGGMAFAELYRATARICRPPMDWTGRLLGPPTISCNLFACSCDSVPTDCITIQLTPSVQGGVVREPL